MSPSSSEKIVRKVFYTTGSALAKADKIKHGLVDIAKSFKAGYQVLGDEPQSTGRENVQGASRPSGQQLEGLYGHLGRIIFENIENKDLSYSFRPGFELLQQKADELLNEISPSSRDSSPAGLRMTARVEASEDDLTKAQSGDPLVRLKGVVQLSRSNTPQARVALLAFAKDPDNLIRRLVVNCINPEEGEDEAFAIVKSINDPDEDVARIAIRKSAKTRNRLAFSYLISRLESENVKIRKEAIDALNAITGSDLGYNPTAAIGQRNEALRLWQKIWQDNQTNVQFLIDEEATRSIFKKKHSQKEPSPAEEHGHKPQHVEKKAKVVIRHSEAKPKNLKAS